MSVIYKAGSSFPPLKRVVIYFSRGNSPLSNKMEYNCFSFHIFPTGIATPSLVTTTGCFSYKERINDRRQTARAVASATELPDTSASSMARASGAVSKSLIVLKHKPNNHNFFKTGFVASVF